MSDRSGLRRVGGNIAALVTGKAGAGLLSIVTLAIVARRLGVENYGVLTLVHGYVTLIGSVVAFSGWHGLVRYGGEALHRGDHGRFLRLVGFLSLIELGFALVAIALAVLLVPLVGPRLGWPPDAIRFAPFYCIAVLATVRATPQGILQLADRFDLIGLHQIVMPIVRLVGALIAWAMGGGLTAFFLVWLAGALAEGISMWLFALGRLPGLVRDYDRPLGTSLRPRGIRRDNPGILPFIATTNADLTLQEFAPNAVPLVIGWVLGPAAVGLFALSLRVSNVIMQPARMMGQASYAVIADLIRRRRFAELSHTVWRSVAIATALAGVLVAVIALFAPTILTLLGGASFAGGAALLIIVAAGRALQAGAPVLIATLTAFGRPGRSIMVNLSASLVFLAVLPLLLGRLGVEGAGLQVLLQAVATIAALTWLVRRLLADPPEMPEDAPEVSS